MSSFLHGFSDSGNLVDSSSDEAKRSEEWLQQVENISRDLLNKGESKSGTAQVKIAILDTGIDTGHPEFQKPGKRISRGGTFREVLEFRADNSGPTKQSLEIRNDFSHGTHVAALLSRVAPHALIYIARVAFVTHELEEDKKTEELEPVSVAAAIRYATQNWKVDMISMALGFDYDYEDINRAIREARNSRIVLFAAASNNGNNHGRRFTFPARHEQVICVSGANPQSTRLADFNPTVSGGSLATLGIAVPSAWPNSVTPKAMSGTSMATPIMAGIAALLVQFVRQLVKTPPDIQDGHYDKGVWQKIENWLFQEHRIMVDILKLKGIEHNSLYIVQPSLAFKDHWELYSDIWKYFKVIMDPNTQTQSVGSIWSISDRQLVILKEVRQATRLLASQLPRSSTREIPRLPYYTPRERELRQSREIGFWLDLHVETPCLWLQGNNAVDISRILRELCQQTGYITVHCLCRRWDEQGLIEPAVILRQTSYSILYQLLCQISDGKLPIPETFSLDSFIDLDDRFDSMLHIQSMARDLLLSTDRPILLAIDNFEALQDNNSSEESDHQEILEGLQALIGLTRIETQVRRPQRTLITTVSRPVALMTLKSELDGRLLRLDSEEAFARRRRLHR